MLSNDRHPPTVKAWDPLVRVFHWSLVFFFLLAFATEDDWMKLHVWAGYAVAMLVAFRLLWGLIGTRTARFLNFVKSPRTALRHLGAMLTGKAPHYLGHNPVAAMMVVALLVSISLVAFTGIVKASVAPVPVGTEDDRTFAVSSAMLQRLARRPVEIARDVMPGITLEVNLLDGVVRHLDLAVHDRLQRGLCGHRPEA